MRKKQSITLTGPIDVYPNGNSLVHLGYVGNRNPDPIESYIVHKTFNTLEVTVGELISTRRVKYLIERGPDVTILPVGKNLNNTGYVTLEVWKKLGGTDNGRRTT
jgi:hypothetical protein